MPISVLSNLRSLTSPQRNAVVASFLGWTPDAFDFFILVFVMKYVAEEFGADIARVTIALTLTLATRPWGRSSSATPPTGLAGGRH